MRNAKTHRDSIIHGAIGEPKNCKFYQRTRTTKDRTDSKLAAATRIALFQRRFAKPNGVAGGAPAAVVMLSTHVRRQTALLRERFRAMFAGVRFLARVHPHVRRQVVTSGKRLRTQVAPEKFSHRHVDRHVVRQTAFPAERLPARAASVRPAAGVHRFVRRQSVALRERFRAHFAREQPVSGVHAHVRRQVAALRERFATDVAPVRPLARVRSRVRKQTAFPGKLFRTRFASKRHVFLDFGESVSCR